MLKIEARVTQSNKQKELGFDSQNYPQKLWIKVYKEPDVVIHTGDISDEGDIDSYIQAKELLDKLDIKYYLTCGNYDNF